MIFLIFCTNQDLANWFATNHYVTAYKTIHMYYLKKSHDLISCQVVGCIKLVTNQFIAKLCPYKNSCRIFHNGRLILCNMSGRISISSTPGYVLYLWRWCFFPSHWPLSFFFYHFIIFFTVIPKKKKKSFKIML